MLMLDGLPLNPLPLLCDIFYLEDLKSQQKEHVKAVFVTWPRLEDLWSKHPPFKECYCILIEKQSFSDSQPKGGLAPSDVTDNL